MITLYFDNIQSVIYWFVTPDPPILFCLDGGKIYMDTVTLIWAPLIGTFFNSASEYFFFANLPALLICFASVREILQSTVSFDHPVGNYC